MITIVVGQELKGVLVAPIITYHIFGRGLIQIQEEKKRCGPREDL